MTARVDLDCLRCTYRAIDGDDLAEHVENVHPGGAEEALSDIATGLSERGYTATVENTGGNCLAVMVTFEGGLAYIGGEGIGWPLGADACMPDGGSVDQADGVAADGTILHWGADGYADRALVLGQRGFIDGAARLADWARDRVRMEVTSDVRDA